MTNDSGIRGLAGQVAVVTGGAMVLISMRMLFVRRQWAGAVPLLPKKTRSCSCSVVATGTKLPTPAVRQFA